MKLPADQYYDDRPVRHAAQGDIHAAVPFLLAVAPPEMDLVRGARKRPGPVTNNQYASSTIVETLGVICTYTCGFLAQPPGTPGYAHPYRQVAPIFSLRRLLDFGLDKRELQRLIEGFSLQTLLYLPINDPADNDAGDEWSGHGAICVWMMTTVTQQLLDDRPRANRLSGEATRLLHSKLIQAFTPNTYDPTTLKYPDLTDSWSTPQPG